MRATNQDLIDRTIAKRNEGGIYSSVYIEIYDSKHVLRDIDSKRLIEPLNDYQTYKTESYEKTDEMIHYLSLAKEQYGVFLNGKCVVQGSLTPGQVAEIEAQNKL